MRPTPSTKVLQRLTGQEIALASVAGSVLVWAGILYWLLA